MANTGLSRIRGEATPETDAPFQMVSVTLSQREIEFLSRTFFTQKALLGDLVAGENELTVERAEKIYELLVDAKVGALGPDWESTDAATTIAAIADKFYA